MDDKDREAFAREMSKNAGIFATGQIISIIGAIIGLISCVVLVALFVFIFL